VQVHEATTLPLVATIASVSITALVPGFITLLAAGKTNGFSPAFRTLRKRVDALRLVHTSAVSIAHISFGSRRGWTGYQQRLP